MSNLGSSDTNMAGETRVLPATNNPVQNRLGRDVLAWTHAELIATESVTLASTSSITSSGNAARAGDALLFTSGTLAKSIFSVISVSGTIYTLGQIASSAPTGGDTFQILRYRPALVDSSGAEVIQNAGLVPEAHDYIELSYSGSDLINVVYKTGGAGGATVATLTLTYSGGLLATITKT